MSKVLVLYYSSYGQRTLGSAKDETISSSGRLFPRASYAERACLEAVWSSAFRGAAVAEFLFRPNRRSALRCAIFSLSFALVGI